MKFSERWLREWVSPAVDTETLAHQLTMAGLEVDALEPAGASQSLVVVGRVDAVEAHPDADHLRVCRVDVGTGNSLRIVCGAPNVRPGLRAPVALPGAVLANGTTVSRANLRGVDSGGMLCSAAELGLADDAGGLMALPDDAPVGEPLHEYLGLNDTLITIELTPNRGDCLSIAGIAREVAVLNRTPLTALADAPAVVAGEARRGVRIDAEADCPRYAGRVVAGLDPLAPTPLWMRERLRRGGLRSVNPVVDVTNYVLLELGQPMHAFDDERLRGDIVVRRARAGEELMLLNREAVDLDPDCLVIADDSGPVAFAGVMGGLATSVGDGTRRVFLESACFSPGAVAGRGRRFKLQSDSLYRFERGVDPGLQVRALERATALLLDICGGQAGPVVECDVRGARERPFIHLRHQRIERLLGTAVPADEVVDILSRLGMTVETGGDNDWRVRPPTFRYDLEHEADLIEEVARIHGYDRLPARTRRVESVFRPVPEARVPTERLREVLVQRDYQEAITYSFVDRSLQARVRPDLSPVDLDNPIAQQYAQMRTSLWSSLLPVWRHNIQRQQERVRLFEVGRRYLREADGLRQDSMIAGLTSGAASVEQWGVPTRLADFHDLKGDVEALLSLGGDPARYHFQADRHPALHPGQSARVMHGEITVGWLGRLHPRLVHDLDVREAPLAFELDLANISTARVPGYAPVPEYPSVRRDLALVLPESVTAEQLLTCVRAAGGALLQSVRVFDVYRGRSLQPGSKSVALGLIYQDKSRTLIDDEVETCVRALQHHLERELDATIRG